MQLFARLAPEDVFTPRSPNVNERMYIERPLLERALGNAVKGNHHIIIHGESGTGKSWLYKRVFSQDSVHFEVGNLANASRFKSVTKELENLVDREEESDVTEYTEEMSAGVTAVVAKGDLKHAKKYRVGKKEPFEKSLSAVRDRAGRRPAVLVLDNLESIFESKDLMDELADLIILLDDPRYAKYQVKLVLVGIPHGIRDYFNRTKSRAAVANRLQELPEVSRLSERAATALIHRGFVDGLKYAFGPQARSEVMYHIP
jgi:Cdc6-like AAA superfamily ATPase